MEPNAGAGEARRESARLGSLERPDVYFLSSRGAERRGTPFGTVRRLRKTFGAQRGPSLRSG